MSHVRLVDPLDRTLEFLRREEASWVIAHAFEGDAHVRTEPFDAIELEMGALWAEVELREKA